MNTFEMTGIAGLYLKYSGNLLDAAVSMSVNALNPPCRTYMRFTAGITGLARGVTLTGATSLAVCSVEGIIITSGALADSDATGVAFVKVASGVPQTDEDWAIPGPTTVMTSRSALLTIPQRGAALEAKSIAVIGETSPLRILWDGTDPTTSTETGDASFGVLINPTAAYIIKGWTNCRNLKMINAVAAANGVANVIISYGGVE